MTMELSGAERDEVRAERQAMRAQQVAWLRARAEALEQASAAKCAEYERLSQDYAWLTQPANPNSPFGKRRQKVVDRYTEGLRLAYEAKQLRQKADALEADPVRVKGDAARRWAERAAANDLVIGKGSRVTSPVYGIGTVLRVNRQTYTVRLDRYGAVLRVDKTHCLLIEEAGDGATS